MGTKNILKGVCICKMAADPYITRQDRHLFHSKLEHNLRHCITDSKYGEIHFRAIGSWFPAIVIIQQSLSSRVYVDKIYTSTGFRYFELITGQFVLREMSSYFSAAQTKGRERKKGEINSKLKHFRKLKLSEV